MSAKVYFYTDCPLFGGCENMPFHLAHAEELSDHFILKLFYRYSERYQKGLDSKSYKKTNAYRVKGIISNSFFVKFKNKYLRYFSILLYSFVLKYPVFLWNTVILFILFLKDKPDLLHINNGGYPGANSCLAAAVVAKILKIPCIMVVNNIAFSRRHVSRWIDGPLDFLVKNGVSQFVTGSTYAADQLRAVLNLKTAQVISIYNGVAVPAVASNRDAVLSACAIPLDPRAIYVGFIAHCEDRKGHRYYLEALRKIQKQVNCRVISIIEGDGPRKKQLLDFSRELKLQDVYFIEYKGSIFDLIQSMDILVLPSVANEDFPNITIEAMGLGKPVVASRLAGIAEQVIHGKTGFLCQPRSVEDLVSYLTRLIQEDPLRAEFGHCGLLTFKEKFNLLVSVEKYSTLYEKILRRNLNESGSFVWRERN